MLRALGCIAEQGPDWLRWTAADGAGSQADPLTASRREAGELSGLGREAGEGLSDASRREAGDANGRERQRLELDCLDDHRMAFCAGLIALRRPVRLRQSAAVSKSFPDFWKEFSVFGPDIQLV